MLRPQNYGSSTADPSGKLTLFCHYDFVKNWDKKTIGVQHNHTFAVSNRPQINHPTFSPIKQAFLKNLTIVPSIFQFPRLTILKIINNYFYYTMFVQDMILKFILTNTFNYSLRAWKRFNWIKSYLIKYLISKTFFNNII